MSGRTIVIDAVLQPRGRQHYVVDATGQTWPICDYLDASGEYCNADTARFAIAGHDSTGWLTVELGEDIIQKVN